MATSWMTSLATNDVLYRSSLERQIPPRGTERENSKTLHARLDVWLPVTFLPPFVIVTSSFSPGLACYVVYM